MKQHLIPFKPNEKYFCKEYLCDFTSCLHFDFENCTNEDVDVEVEDTSSEDLFDEEIDQTEQIFDFIRVPSFVLCILEVQSSQSILSKLLEKVSPKRTFLIPTDTLSQKVRDISKDYT